MGIVDSDKVLQVTLGDILYIRFVAVADNIILNDYDDKAVAQKMFIVSVGRKVKTVNFTEISNWKAIKTDYYTMVDELFKLCNATN